MSFCWLVGWSIGRTTNKQNDKIIIFHRIGSVSICKYDHVDPAALQPPVHTPAPGQPRLLPLPGNALGPALAQLSGGIAVTVAAASPTAPQELCSLIRPVLLATKKLEN